MGLIWKRSVAADYYEVRTSGNTVRLYSNGVFHSQFNPRTPITGSFWELLMIPAFFRPMGAANRILLLGVGGGAVIQLLNRFVSLEILIGVEINPIHIQVAKRFFGVTPKQARLICADAVAWMKEYDGPPFDMIIDDLFGDADGEPQRAVSPNARWFNSLTPHLSQDGLIVMNFVSRTELDSCAYSMNRKIRDRFSAAYRIWSPRFENVVGCFLKAPYSNTELRTNLVETPGLNPRLKTGRLSYRIRRL